MPDAIQSTFAVDFSHTQLTRADNIGLLNLPLVETTHFVTFEKYHSLRIPSVACHSPHIQQQIFSNLLSFRVFKSNV